MFSFPLQSRESRMIQLIFKDTSIWLKMPYLNSTDCLDYITIDYSWSLDTTSDVGTGLGELNHIQLILKPVATSKKQLQWPAEPYRCHYFQSRICKHFCQQITSCRYSKRLNNTTLMNELLMCESLTRSWAATNKASDVPSSETEIVFLKWCIF